MARRIWVIGAAGAALVAFVAAQSSSDGTAVTAATSTPTSTPTRAATSTIPAPTSTTTTTEPPQTSTTSTTVLTPSTTSSSTTTSTLARASGPFNAAAFDAVIAAATVDKGDLSAGAAVMRDGDVLHTAAFGMENPFEAKVATVDTRFRIASVSKMLTSVAIMQLVNEGLVQLDKPFPPQLGVHESFNDPRIAGVTVRQLLSHTSGFGASRNLYFGRAVETWKQAAAAALGEQLQFDPGTAFQYSNTNFCLLGMLIESITDQSFESVIRERVLDPIGAAAHLAPTFDTKPGDALHASAPGRNYMEALGPAGGWVATPLDVAKLASALRTESSGVHLLDQVTVDAMRVPVPVPIPVDVPTLVRGWSYGLGLLLYADGSWGHTGSIESTHAIVVNRPDGLTVAVLVSGKVPGNTDQLLAVIDLAVAASSAP